jgi:hypothetical protein
MYFRFHPAFAPQWLAMAGKQETGNVKKILPAAAKL